MSRKSIWFYCRFQKYNKKYQEHLKSYEAEKDSAAKKIDLTIDELVRNGILQSEVSVIHQIMRKKNYNCSLFLVFRYSNCTKLWRFYSRVVRIWCCRLYLHILWLNAIKQSSSKKINEIWKKQWTFFPDICNRISPLNR